MNVYPFLAQLLELAMALILAPILNGWINQCRAWLQNRSAPPLLQTYYTPVSYTHPAVYKRQSHPRRSQGLRPLRPRG